ncbi:archaeoflavoprotein AfpA [Candidatus Bathycorpusculum sp.]|uniref:archaeoflavoprotein AfpA n=1 Tax=Candidatus Bathycorpusculum sp. TaxID=2994959 RepID=UPI00282CB1ED|nr:archaeoflavoprotein AfpA [Candidatus Termitimicrobium sp.]MCL2432500.1 archaeoflavoprotein AfpA [Candidatus Termitimicrobium sp.]MDR0470187.1 archaeoflavoprotein AfpA [Nitrososphaerota archaeon]
MTEKKEIKKLKVAWGITGAGDKIQEIIETMKTLKQQTEDKVDIDVYVSKAADTMLKFYRLDEILKSSFPKVFVESNSNSPFLAGMVQSGKYEFLLLCPASSNTVAKIVNSISDTLLTNAALMALKAFVPVWIMPVDFKENIIFTKLPNGKEMKLRVRKEEAAQVRHLETMDDVHVFETPQKVQEGFLEWLKNKSAS